MKTLNSQKGFTPSEVREPRKKRKENKPLTGFTLVEMLVYIAVLAILVLAVSSFLIWTIHSNTKARAMREVLDNARRAMEIMTYEIKEAKSVYTPTTTSSQLSLETTKYLPEGEEASFLDFYLCEKHLCFKKESQVPIILNSEMVEVNNLKFTKVGINPPSVQIELGVNFKNPHNRPEYQFSINLNSTVSLRSY